MLRKKSQWEGDKTEEEEADQVEDIQKRRKKMRLNERRYRSQQSLIIRRKILSLSVVLFVF